jgi:hypothetical protein
VTKVFVRALMLAIVAFGVTASTQTLHDGTAPPTCDPFKQHCTNP